MSNTTKPKPKVQTIKFTDKDFRECLTQELGAIKLKGSLSQGRLRSWAKRIADLTVDEVIYEYSKLITKKSSLSRKEREFLSYLMGKALKKTRLKRKKSKGEEE